MGIDIDKPLFDPVRKHLAAAKKQLHRDGLGNLPNRADTLTGKEVFKIFEDRVAGLHSPIALTNAVAIFTLWFGRRGGEELRLSCIGDLKVVVKNNIPTLVLNGERVSKSRQGSNPHHVRFGVPELKSLKDTERCPVTIFLKYLEKRPANMQHDDAPMFLRPVKGSQKDPRKKMKSPRPWFNKTPLGRNSVSLLVRTMVGFAGINTANRKLTNSSIRKMTVTTLNEAGFSPADIVLYTGHRNQSSLINYTSLTADKAGAITEALMGRETVSEEDEPAPPIIHSSPTGTPKRLNGNARRSILTSKVSFPMSRLNSLGKERKNDAEEK